VLRLENMAKHWTLSEMEQQLDEGQWTEINGKAKSIIE
jgi:hypothetical protein